VYLNELIAIPGSFVANNLKGKEKIFTHFTFLVSEDFGKCSAQYQEKGN
jgi:hypothetical protein